MLNPIVWLSLFTIAGLMTTVAVWVVRAQRRCPGCRTTLVDLPRPEDRSYDILACPACPTAATLAVGQRARFSWCPSCRQRALQTPCIRRPSEDGALIVEVHEQCHLCDHREVVVAEGPPPPRGIVVPFPGDAKRQAGGRR